MAQLVYTITGNNTGLATAVNNSIALIGKLQAAVDKLNATSFSGLTSSLQSVATAMNSAATGAQVLNTSLQNGVRAANSYQTSLASLNARGVTPLSSGMQGLTSNMVTLNQSLAQSGGSGSGLFSLISGYTALFTAIAVVKKVISSNAEISDSLADVRRTASLTAAETDNLFKSLEKINTRTSLKGLIDISTIGGQLGIAKDQLAGFTRATDLLNVALGGEIQGGPEKIAKGLGILNNVFKISENQGGDVEKAFNQIGSSILGLGQSGLATGDFLVTFGEKVGGVAAQAKLTLPTLLSYGAVLQEQGVTAEVAGTAFKKLLAGLATKSPKFLAVAQIADSSLTLKQFNNLINTDTQAALELFFAGLRKGGPTTTTFLSLLKSVGLDAARSGQAISAIALNLDSLHEHFKQSNTDFDEGSKAAEQAALKNDTLGASIDKLGNSFVKLTTSGAIGNFFKAIIDGATGALTATDKLFKSTSFAEFVARLPGPTSTKGFDIVHEATDAFANSKKQFATVQDPFSQSPTVLLNNLNILKSAYKDAFHAYSVYFDGIQSGIIENATAPAQRATLNSLKQNAQDILAVFNNVQKRLGVVGLPVKPTGPGVTLPGKSKLGTSDGLFDSLNRQLDEIFTKTQSSFNASGLTGYALEVQKITDKYKDQDTAIQVLLNRQKQLLDKGKITPKQFSVASTKAQTDFDITDQAKQKALSDAKIAEATRVQNEIQRINDAFGVKAEQSRGRELALIQARYDAEVKKAQGNADILKAIESGRLAAIQSVNDKYQALQDDLYAKIGFIEDQALAATKNKLETETDRIQIEWEKRRKAADDYYDNLRKIAASTPNNPTDVLPGLTNAFANLNLKRQQLTTGTLIDNGEATDVTKANTKEFTDALNSGLQDATKNVFQYFTTLNQQADQTFGTIFSNLTTKITASFDDIFLNVVEKGLAKALAAGIKDGTNALVGSDGKLTGLGAATAGAGLLGGVISGSSAQTSSGGQALGGALSGAAAGVTGAVAIGATIGTAAGPIGIAIGAVAGALIGFTAGLFKASAARKAENAALLAQAQQQTALLRASVAFTTSIIGRMTNQGLITDVNLNATGQLVATVSGKQLQFVLDRNGR